MTDSVTRSPSFPTTPSASRNAVSKLADARDHEASWREWYRLTPLQRGHESMKLCEEALQRPLLAEAMAGNTTAVGQELEREQARENEADRAYWNPPKRKLEKLRRDRNRET